MRRINGWDGAGNPSRLCVTVDRCLRVHFRGHCQIGTVGCCFGPLLLVLFIDPQIIVARIDRPKAPVSRSERMCYPVIM